RIPRGSPGPRTGSSNSITDGSSRRRSTLARAVVAGCARFIGNPPPGPLLQDGHDVLGVDCFNDNYARADKRENLSTAAAYENFRLLTADLVNVDAEALLDGAAAVYHLAGG